MKGTNRDGLPKGSDSDGCQACWSPVETTPKVMIQVARVLGRSGSSVVNGHRARYVVIGHSLVGSGGFTFEYPGRGKDMVSHVFSWWRGAPVIYASWISLGWGPCPIRCEWEIWLNMACYY